MSADRWVRVIGPDFTVEVYLEYGRVRIVNALLNNQAHLHDLIGISENLLRAFCHAFDWKIKEDRARPIKIKLAE